MKELYRFRQFLTEGKLLKEDQKYYSLLNDLRDEGLLNKSGISGLQSKFNLSKEKAKEIFDEYLEDLKAEQPDAFDFFMKDLAEGRLLKEGIPQESEIADYVTAMYDDSVVEKEGFQSDIWTKEEYTSPTRDGASVFIALMKHLNSVGGKDVLEGNPDIHLELLPNGDIKWSADVTFFENKINEAYNKTEEAVMKKIGVHQKVEELVDLIRDAIMKGEATDEEVGTTDVLGKYIGDLFQEINSEKQEK